jgi:hypothetical protein
VRGFVYALRLTFSGRLRNETDERAEHS